MTMTAPDRFQELQKRFLVGLERRMSDVTTTLNDSADPESLMRMFHSLAGIGGTYGFSRITEVSRFCEALCGNAIEEQRTITFHEKEHLRRAGVEIRASVAPQPGTVPIAA